MKYKYGSVVFKLPHLGAAAFEGVTQSHPVAWTQAQAPSVHNQATYLRSLFVPGIQADSTSRKADVPLHPGRTCAAHQNCNQQDRDHRSFLPRNDFVDGVVAQIAAAAGAVGQQRGAAKLDDVEKKCIAK